MKQADRVILEKIVVYCDDVISIVDEIDRRYEIYEKNKIYQYATAMCILQIGELVGRLSEETTAFLSDIPWRAIKGMRNLYAHNYERTKLSIIWNTLVEDIPALKSRLQRILSES